MTIPLMTRNTRLILVPVVSTSVPVTVVNEKRETLLLTPDETSRVLPTQSSAKIYLLIASHIFLCHWFLKAKILLFFSF